MMPLCHIVSQQGLKGIAKIKQKKGVITKKSTFSRDRLKKKHYLCAKLWL
jgi:hypothetical protein